MTDFAAIARSIDAALPSMARQVIQTHLDLTDERNADFLRRPDEREQHQTQWHQWGILTHTRVFLRHFDSDIPAYLEEWGLWRAARRNFDRKIDGVAKWDLLHVSILLHDIGKFAARTRGKQRFHFSHHEELSGEIIRGELDLARYGLTPAQIEYIALTAEDHFVLGLLRKRLREQGAYEVGFTHTRRFAELARSIRAEHPQDYVEIGVLFLGDSLAKVDPRSGPALAVSQYETNIELAHAYLSVVLGNAPYNES